MKTPYDAPRGGGCTADILFLIVVFVCLALIASVVCASGGTAEAAKPNPTAVNTLTLTNEPAYGGDAEFDLYLSKHYQRPLLAGWCYQSGQAVMVKHGFIPKYKSSFTGPVSITITYTPNLGDPSQPASCVVAAFDEKKSNQQDEELLTHWVYFTVPGVGG